MRRQRNTKIIATLGLATATRQEIRGLFGAGADVFCMDMRYGTHAGHLARYDMVREVEKEVARPIGDTAPTPAQANDVAAAIYEGADGMMPTAETASGKYPAEATRMVDRLARRVEPICCELDGVEQEGLY